MKNLILVLVLIMAGCTSINQNKTDVSLHWKDAKEQVSEIESETGDLYNKVGHHGPAIENEWLGLRIYFNYKVAIDVYSKTKAQLELAETDWYSTPEQQLEGWGADQYKVSKTGGLGGVRLWDGEKAVFLESVTLRKASVKKEANSSSMEMLSKGISYNGEIIDVLLKVTVYSGQREAKVEAFVESLNPVQLVTGINYHQATQVTQGENYICTWGIHPEDVAVFQLNIGAAIMYNPNDFEQKVETDTEILLVSKPTKYLSTWITSSCEKEEELNTMADFVKYVALFNN